MSEAPSESGKIAVIAATGRFPGAVSVEALWELLLAGREGITRFTREELLAAGIPADVIDDPSYVPARGVIPELGCFDAELFGFSPREAALLDPQHRLFLECCWEALERAGHDPSRERGWIGVYAGCGMSQYLLHHLRPDVEFLGTSAGFQMITCNGQDFLATRAAYGLNLRGPAVAVQTACSTSLVAVHLACQDLLTHQCDMALAGGASLQLPAVGGYFYSPGSIASPDGHCRAFDAAALGTVPGSGCGVVVLRRLADALADGDPILAVVRGSAINNDGAQKVGFTAPSVQGQSAAIACAHEIAGVEADDISYVEAHGTGTILGDPIEVRALTEVFRRTRRRRGKCAIGSLKTNLGHLDAAAGVAGLIKTVLMLSHATLVPSLHFQRSNPALDLVESPFYVCDRLQPWPSRPASPRIAGVSSFGIGGTNAHVVVEEAPARPMRVSSRDGDRASPICLSARSAEALDRLVTRASSVLGTTEGALEDLGYTLDVGRQRLPHRVVGVGATAAEVVVALADARARGEGDDPASESAASVVFLASGQGAQYAGMGAALYASEPSIRDELAALLAFLGDTHGLDLAPVVGWGRPVALDAAVAIRRTEIAQPALFCLELAVAHFWERMGVAPRALVGHSLGEYVAATLAGVMTVEDALSLVVHRGRLMARMPSGAMLACAAGETELAAVLPRGAELAAINAPQAVTASGELGAIAELRSVLDRLSIRYRELDTSHAFHSAMMEPILDDFAGLVAALRLSPPRVPFLSNVTGTWIRDDEAIDPGYWARHIRHPVRFAECVRTLLTLPRPVMIEIGPGHTLASLVRMVDGAAQGSFPVIETSVPSLAEGEVAHKHLINAAGRLWGRGLPVEFASLWPADARRIQAPTYPFARTRHWIEAAPPRSAGACTRTDVDSVSPFEGMPPRLADPERWLINEVWEPFHGECPMMSAHGWVVVDDNSLLSTRISARLWAEGRLVGRVRTSDRESIERLVRGLQAGSVGVLDFSGYQSDASPLHQAIRTSVERGFCGTAAIIAAMQKCPGIDLVRMLSVTTGVFGGQGSMCRPENAIGLGPTLVAPVEHEGLTATLIDIDVGDNGPDDEVLSAALYELLESDIQDSVLRLTRDGTRLRRRHRESDAIPLTDAARGELLRAGEVYVITGGFSGLGALFADFITSTTPARIALLGRRGAATPGADALIRRLEEKGAEVLALEVDIANAGSVQAGVDKIRVRWGAPVAGVFHAAGVGGSGLLHELQEADRCKAIWPKVLGALHLDEALADDGAAWWIFCSSLAGHAFAMHLHSDYAAANAMEDALARRWRQLGRRATSIAWDGWATGMSGHRDPTSPLMRILLESRICADEASLAFSLALRALVGGHATAVVCTRGAAFLDEPRLLPNCLRRSLLGARATARSQPVAARPVSPTERQLVQLWQEALGHTSIGLEDDFFALGGHSLVAIEIIAGVRQRFGIEMGLDDFLSRPTIAGLAAWLVANSPNHARADAADRLVCLQEGNRGVAPLFLIHPAGGLVFCYAELARALGPERPVYAIRSLSDDLDEAEPLTVPRLAMRYLASIMSVAPDGPYLLGGASLGGMIAFEIAQILVSRGQNPSTVIMWDTPSPAEMGLAAERFSCGADIDAYLAELAPELVEVLASRTELPTELRPERFHALFLRHCGEGAVYDPGPYGGPIIYFRAETRDAYNPMRPEVRWLEIARNGIHFSVVSGGHLSMLAEPHVEECARQLRRLLQMCPSGVIATEVEHQPAHC